MKGLVSQLPFHPDAQISRIKVKGTKQCFAGRLFHSFYFFLAPLSGIGAIPLRFFGAEGFMNARRSGVPDSDAFSLVIDLFRTRAADAAAVVALAGRKNVAGAGFLEKRDLCELSD